MGSYVKFAWRDAMELACLLEETFDPVDARDLFERYDQDGLASIEARLRTEVASIIAAVPSRRPAIVRRIAASNGSSGYAGLALVFAVMAQVRAMDELDRLSPGGGNRDTCAACYSMEATRRHSRVVYEFPYEVFSAYGSDADFFS